MDVNLRPKRQGWILRWQWGCVTLVEVQLAFSESVWQFVDSLLPVRGNITLLMVIVLVRKSHTSKIVHHHLKRQNSFSHCASLHPGDINGYLRIQCLGVTLR